MNAYYLNDLGIVCAMGSSKQEVAQLLFSPAYPDSLTISDEYLPGRSLFVGRVNSPLPDLAHLAVHWRSRNNQLLLAAAEQIRPAVDTAVKKYGAHRVAIVLGTSTSGVGESEAAHRYYSQTAAWPEGFHYGQQETGAPALFLSHVLGVQGPCHVISTACSSGAKAIAAGARLLSAGFADAVIVGGADSLCAFTLAGFSALESISPEPCNPFSENRRGINIGEGAALFLMSHEPALVSLMGWGESSDAHHMSAPEPEGAGAKTALLQSLQRARISAHEVDYINLHGTATIQNDAMEARVVSDIFGQGTPASSTKAMTGHALGAAGAIEAGLCWLSMAHNPQNVLPVHWWDEKIDASIPAIQLVKPGQKAQAPLRHVVSQSFAFGGSNVAICLGRN